MKVFKKVILSVVLLTAMIVINLLNAFAALPTDANQYVSVLVDYKSSIVLRDTTSVCIPDVDNGSLKFSLFNVSNSKETDLFTVNVGKHFVYACKDTTLYYGSTAGGWVESFIPSGENYKTLNNYHLQASEAYSSYSEVASAVAYAKSKGYSAFPAYLEGKYYIRIGNYASISDAQNAIDSVSLSLAGSNASYSVETNDGKTDFKTTIAATVIGKDDALNVNNFPNGLYILDGNGNKEQITLSSSYGTFSAVGGDSDTICMVDATTGEILLEYKMTGDYYLRVSESGGALLYHRTNDMSNLVNKNNVYNTTDGVKIAGTLNFRIDTKSNTKKIGTVNYVKMQDYLIGVSSSEVYMDRYSDVSKYLESYKAHIVCSRSFAYTARKHFPSTSDIGAMLCNTAQCQCYGYTAYSDKEIIKRCVEETEGIIVTYNGSIAEMFYSAFNGGASMTNGEAWYLWSSSAGKYVKGTDVGYIRAITDPYDDDDLYSGFVYNRTKKYTSSQLYNLLYNGGANNTSINQYPGWFTADMNSITAVDITKRNSVGIPVEMAFTTNKGPQVTTGGGGNIRNALGGILSAYITEININGSEISIKYTGNGHGVGLSQYGSFARSKAGHTYKQILDAYYQNLGYYNIKTGGMVS